MLDAFVVRLLRRLVDVCHVAAPQHNVNRFVIKRTRSPSRRRRWGCLRTPTAPARTHCPGRRAAGRAKSRARVTAPSTMVAMMPQYRSMAASSNMKSLIAGGKHVRSVMSRSPLMRPSTRSPHVGADAPDTLPRSLYGLLTVDGTTGRRAPSRSRCAVHQAWCPSQGS